MAENAGPNDQVCCLPWLALVTKLTVGDKGTWQQAQGSCGQAQGCWQQVKAHLQALSDPCLTPHSQLSPLSWGCEDCSSLVDISPSTCISALGKFQTVCYSNYQTRIRPHQAVSTELWDCVI